MSKRGNSREENDPVVLRKKRRLRSCLYSYWEQKKKKGYGSTSMICLKEPDVNQDYVEKNQNCCPNGEDDVDIVASPRKNGNEVFIEGNNEDEASNVHKNLHKGLNEEKSEGKVLDERKNKDEGPTEEKCGDERLKEEKIVDKDFKERKNKDKVLDQRANKVEVLNEEKYRDDGFIEEKIKDEGTNEEQIKDDSPDEGKNEDGPHDEHNEDVGLNEVKNEVLNEEKNEGPIDENNEDRGSSSIVKVEGYKEEKDEKGSIYENNEDKGPNAVKTEGPNEEKNEENPNENKREDGNPNEEKNEEGSNESKNENKAPKVEKNEDERSSLSNISSNDSDASDKLTLSELDELLDADLPSEYKKPVSTNFIQRLNERRKLNGDFVEVEKTMLDDISGDHFDLLPETWIQVMHNTGIPVYLDRPNRVCSLARPYFLGSGNIYNHRIPLSAVPCLQYRQVMNKLACSKVEDCTRLIGNLRVPITKVETVYDNHRSQSLEAAEIRAYYQKLFGFKKVFIKRNKHIKNKSSLRMFHCKNFKNRPSLPAGTKLLSFISFERDGKGEVIRRREWIMNPSGKSYIAILHEYLQQSLKIQPVYEFKENETEYESTVKLNNVVFGRGVGPSKKEAKLNAAKMTLETLIPELNGKAEEICGINVKKSANPEASMESNNIFDEIKITDPRIAEFCARTTEPSPYSMLLTCLRRNCGTVDVDTDYAVSLRHNKSNLFTMTVGKHTVSVYCRNKRDGKQKAAQAILQALHPQLKTWGSLVRLYGNKSVKNAKEKKLEEQEITQLQTQAKINSPNYAILNKLNEELEKLYRKRMEMKPVGTLITSDTPKNSAVNLNPLNYA